MTYPIPANTRGHHYAVVALEADEQDALLDWASDGGMSVHALRGEVRRFKQQKKRNEAAALLASIDRRSTIVQCADALAVAWPQGADLIPQASGVRGGKGSWDEWLYDDLHAFNHVWITRYQGQTSQHAREAAMLVFGLKVPSPESLSEATLGLYAPPGKRHDP